MVEFEELDAESFNVFLMHAAMRHAPMFLGYQHVFAVETLKNQGHKADGLRFVVDDKEFVVAVNEVTERVRVPDA